MWPHCYVKVEVAVLGSPSLISLIVSADCCVKVEVAVLGSPSLISLIVSADCCVKVEVAVLGFPSLISLIVYVDVLLCESRSGRPGLPVPNSPHGLCGRRAALNSNLK